MSLRQDCWGQFVEPADSTMGAWFDQRLARAELPAALNQYSGDLICPLCEAPLEITGLSDGFCASCMAHVEIA